jgi:hypothetical protein
MTLLLGYLFHLKLGKWLHSTERTPFSEKNTIERSLSRKIASKESTVVRNYHLLYC